MTHLFYCAIILLLEQLYVGKIIGCLCGDRINMNTRVKKMAYTALFTVIIIACTFIKIPIPIIPFTMQVFAVLMAGLVLGPWLGAASVVLYILLGLTGLPIFAAGGGIGYVMVPSFGYMIGFIFGAMLTGFMARRSSGKYWQLIVSSLAGVAIIYVVGLSYLYLMSNFVLGTPRTVSAVLMSGFVVVLPGDIIKTILASAVALKLMPLVNRSYNKTVLPGESVQKSVLNEPAILDESGLISIHNESVDSETELYMPLDSEIDCIAEQETAIEQS